MPYWLQEWLDRHTGFGQRMGPTESGPTESGPTHFSGIVVSRKDKKARRAALRDFLVAIPGALERATALLGWLVVLGAVALGALLLHLLFGHDGHRPVPPPGGHGDNPAGALYVRDMGRLPDGRHTFDLVYDVVLRNETGRRFGVDFSLDRLALSDGASSGDVVELGHAPGLFDEGPARSAAAWRVVSSRATVAGACPARLPVQGLLEAHRLIPAGAVDCQVGLSGDYPPGRWRNHQAHYRIVARVEQIADVAIGYGIGQGPRGWFDFSKPDGEDALRHADAHDEEVQLGAVLRAHCPLGVKVQHGEVRSLCGS